jgi:hypothetical protein
MDLIKAHRKSQSPQGVVRNSIRHAYKVRGRRNENIWIVYSIKLDEDLLIKSDSELIHWLMHLETNAEVVSFSLRDLAAGNDAIIGAAEARYKNGGVFCHYISYGVMDEEGHSNSEKGERASGDDAIVYTIADLTRAAPYAMAWLSALAFAAAIRGQIQAPTAESVERYVSETRNGCIKDIVEALHDHDESVVIGLIVRFAIKGKLNLKIEKKGFGYLTEWSQIE